ncbi:MauE/DoxX family redox-associated membrane protein [Streptomyces sp. RKAG293]|uniref:MauE/DoxX family redox-associated membrane protein n=1 Tax=Streptomyces sp. RKAG293 TaxID=2893403 RepID=UPI002034610E|nr:MauE/DoxX family redox-associated membrane protein [Streptomyces sp. RKAG293]MCM2420607.1 hypothetical protein [Streptomyces sp. RKAG293]
MTVTELAARVMLAVVFAVAAISKCRSRATMTRFTAGLDDFVWLPARFRTPTAIGVVISELAAVLLLFTLREAGAALVLGLLVAFTVATVQAGRAAACRCFSSATTPGTGSTAAFVTRNALLAAAALAAGLLPGGAETLPVWGAAAGAGAIAGAVTIGWDELVYLLGDSATSA